MSWHRGYVAAGPWGRAQPRRLPHPYHRATPCSTGPRSEGRGSQLTAPGIPGTDCACPVPGTGGPESSRGTTTLGRPAQQHRDPEVAKPPSPESPGSLLLPATPRRRQGPSAWGEGQNTGTSGCSLQGRQLHGSEDLQAPLPTTPEQSPG